MGGVGGSFEIRSVYRNPGRRRDADFIVACSFRRMVVAAAGIRFIPGN
jgi:hypothetical protein